MTVEIISSNRQIPTSGCIQVSFIEKPFSRNHSLSLRVVTVRLRYILNVLFHVPKLETGPPFLGDHPSLVKVLQTLGVGLQSGFLSAELIQAGGYISDFLLNRIDWPFSC